MEYEMKRAFMVLTSLLALGCDSRIGPSPLYSSYFLSTVDGHPLPAPFTPEGWVLLSSTLGFDQRHLLAATPPTGMVSYMVVLRRPDQTIEQSTIGLNYSIHDGILRIDLCPPLALCIVNTELVGTVTGRTNELVLTNYLAGTPGSVYRYFPSLPD
jgi:hypothetical protein